MLAPIKPMLQDATLEAYFDFIDGGLVFKDESEIDKTYDVVINAIFADLSASDNIGLAEVYSDAMILAKSIYKRRLKQDDSRPEPTAASV